MEQVSEEDVKGRTSGEFVESSVLDTCVPLASSTDVQELLSDWDGTEDESSSALLPFIAERDTVFFDETIPVYVVLRTPYIEEDTLNSYLARLALSLECHVTSTTPPLKVSGEHTVPTKEILASETIEDSSEPVVVVSKSQDISDSSNAAHMYLIWRVNIFIGHPRIRLGRPAVFFTASASLRPSQRQEPRLDDDEYMISLEPAPMNLLQAFSDDASFGETRPKLSASRVTKISLSAPLTKELLRPIRNAARRLFKVAYAFTWRIRYSRWHASNSGNSIIACLDIETTPLAGGPMKISDVNMDLVDGKVIPYADFNSQNTLSICETGDQLTLLFKLTPNDWDPLGGSKDSAVCPLDLVIKGEVLISDACRPSIAVEWRTGIEFSTEPRPHTAKAHTLERPVSQASIPQVPAHGTSHPPGPDSLPNAEDSQSQPDELQLSDISMTLSISGPQKVRMGEIFQWSIFMVNRSEKPRRLALVVIPRRRKADTKRHEVHQSSGSHKLSGGNDVAEAVADENIVYAKQRHAKVDPVELICLSTDVRVGPLAPSACYNAELRFLPLATGMLSIDAIRIIDIATQESADVRDVPSILSFETSE